MAVNEVLAKDGNCFLIPFVLSIQTPALPISFRNLFTEICVLKRWEELTVKSTVIAAASAFKRSIRKSVVDPYAISPEVDGRIHNVDEVAAQ